MLKEKNFVTANFEMKKIEILCFGGAAAIRQTDETPFKRFINYYSINDSLFYVVLEAVIASILTGLSMITNSSSAATKTTTIPKNSQQQQQLLQIQKQQQQQEDEFCFLEPKGGDPLVHHPLLGPTYSLALQWEGIRYQQIYVHPIERYYKQYMMILLVKQFFKVQYLYYQKLIR